METRSLRVLSYTRLFLGLAEGDGGELLISTHGGMRRLVNERAEPYALRGVSQNFNKLLRDHDGGLWVGNTGSGVLHVRQGRIDRFSHSDGLSGDVVSVLFQDREGSIWVGTTDGLDRFREFAIPTMTAKQGLSNGAVNAVLAARDGSIWLGTQKGLDRWRNGELTIYGKRDGLPDAAVFFLLQDQVGRIWVSTSRGIAYSEDGKFMPGPGVPVGFPVVLDSSGDLWTSKSRSLFHWRPGTPLEEISWLELGRKDSTIAMLPDPAQGGLWFGFTQGASRTSKIVKFASRMTARMD